MKWLAGVLVFGLWSGTALTQEPPFGFTQEELDQAAARLCLDDKVSILRIQSVVRDLRELSEGKVRWLEESWIPLLEAMDAETARDNNTRNLLLLFVQDNIEMEEQKQLALEMLADQSWLVGGAVESRTQ